MYIYKGEILFSLVCTFRKVINCFELKVALRFRKEVDNICASLI